MIDFEGFVESYFCSLKCNSEGVMKDENDGMFEKR